MTKSETEVLKHSVAFRVTDKEWQALKERAESENTSIPQLAKELLFRAVGFEWGKPKRNTEGQRVVVRPKS